MMTGIRKDFKLGANQFRDSNNEDIVLRLA